ncbi:MAG: DNA polymerase II large subunit [Euryarchaeota archaeon]|nr:DNA polymerase II large subunit [Euryarchaeota archaeon]
MQIEEYFSLLEERVKEALERAQEARRRGLDPSLEVEIPLAKDMAERVEGLVGPPKVAPRIRELCSEVSAEEAAITIAREIVEGKFGSFDSREAAAEQALRTALAILTEGIVAAPLEGIVKVKIKKNGDGSEYLAIYFAGPIRSAGGSAQALAVLVGDVIRQALSLGRYSATEEEVERFVEEVDLYHHEAARLQYFPSAQEVRIAVRSLPVEVTGEPTEKVEVAGYRDLPRVETNQLRGGAVLVLAEGLLQKAPKVLKHVRRLGIEGWEWLAELVSGKEKKGGEEEKPSGEAKIEPSFKYIKDLVAGRPVLSHPSAKGGFRLRYGRSRASGFASMAMHPATMVITGGFIAIGTQLKTERPGKGTAVTPCDTIEGPVVKLRDGSVVRVTSVEQARELLEEVEEILFLGDLLVNYGDFLENNHPLAPAGYCEEWWVQELERALGEGEGQEYRRFLDPLQVPSEEEALEISLKLRVPLHPRYTYFYHDVTKEDLKALAEWVFSGREEDGALVLEMSPEKRVLELLCVPHRVVEGRVVLEEYRALLHCLGSSMERFSKAYERSRDAMELVNSFGVEVRPKAPTYIGARMGRPEKAKERRMSPPVNVLFPIGNAGGKTRDVKKAAQLGKVKVEVAYRECGKCGEVSFFTRCPRCGGETRLRRVCPSCGFTGDAQESCPKCGGRLAYYSEREVELKKLLSRAERRVGSTQGELKGVIGMTSRYKIPEALEKGILRSRNGVFVFKDGTARFDATDVPVTHVRPREIGVSVEKMRELGYTRDYKGNPLESEEQIVELFPQDIILPESGAEYLLRVARFVDELLEEFYGLEPYYNASTKEDLLGHLVLGLAPHTSAAILGRIVGFSRASVGYAHPYFHAAKRRNCDGDEDSVFLMMDAFLNFSRFFLPATRGGTMDAPLVLTTRLDPSEVDSEAHNIDIVERYPLEFYEATLRCAKPQEFEDRIETVRQRLGRREVYYNLKFTHDTSDISAGVTISAYKTLKEMVDKLDKQLSLARKLRSVDERDVARRVIESHFLPDLAGNLRAFATQKVRCVNCNAKYRRVPLLGRCRRCGGKLVLTVARGSVEKYLRVTEDLLERYSLEDYLRQRVKILRMSIESIFIDESVEQKSLKDYFG